MKNNENIHNHLHTRGRVPLVYLQQADPQVLAWVQNHRSGTEIHEGGMAMICPKCNRLATFIRDRGFRDGSGKVYTCRNVQCANYNLYFYPIPIKSPISDADYAKLGPRQLDELGDDE